MFIELTHSLGRTSTAPRTGTGADRNRRQNPFLDVDPPVPLSCAAMPPKPRLREWNGDPPDYGKSGNSSLFVLCSVVFLHCSDRVLGGAIDNYFRCFGSFVCSWERSILVSSVVPWLLARYRWFSIVCRERSKIEQVSVARV